uniref:Putative secreted protein n=1 Tax=Anopheles darlingi TaxID=43151 RepID=A0A2M4D7U7_ANODA
MAVPFRLPSRSELAQVIASAAAAAAAAAGTRDREVPQTVVLKSLQGVLLCFVVGVVPGVTTNQVELAFGWFGEVSGDNLSSPITRENSVS